jgi:DNA-directed RNA polymerase specialized sigma24 family protein
MGNDTTVNELLTKLNRSLDILVLLKLQEIQAGRNQTDMILLLDSVGLSSTEIAKLLDTTRSTVTKAISRARKNKSDKE